MVADRGVTPFGATSRLAVISATREDDQNDLQECLNEWVGDFTSTRILNVGVAFTHIRTMAILKGDRPVRFSGSDSK
jgi:hypothetical protein